MEWDVGSVTVTERHLTATVTVNADGAYAPSKHDISNGIAAAIEFLEKERSIEQICSVVPLPDSSWYASFIIVARMRDDG